MPKCNSRRLYNDPENALTGIPETGYRRQDHRTIWEEEHGQPVPFWSVIHHRDGDKRNNHPSNLRCMSRVCHTALHALQRKRYKAAHPEQFPSVAPKLSRSERIERHLASKLQGLL